MIKKTDTMMIRILEFITLLGEAASGEIKMFSTSWINIVVNAMAHTNYERNTPGKGDIVSFVITRINRNTEM